MLPVGFLFFSYVFSNLLHEIFIYDNILGNTRTYIYIYIYIYMYIYIYIYTMPCLNYYTCMLYFIFEIYCDRNNELNETLLFHSAN